MKDKPYGKAPEGKLILRTLAMPSDTNANGDIFRRLDYVADGFRRCNFSQRVGKR